MKIYLKKLLSLFVIVFAFSFQAVLSQTVAVGERHVMSVDGAAQGEFIQNVNWEHDTQYGIGFYTASSLRMYLQSDLFHVIVPSQFDEAAFSEVNTQNLISTYSTSLAGPINLSGTVSNFSMVPDGEITNLGILQGTNNLSFKGASGDIDMIITESGSIGMGTSNDYPSKLVIVGQDNDGTEAILNLRNDGHSMLLDGNEIDATAGTLFLQNNSTHDISSVQGGGNFGVGLVNPEEKLHVRGNLRIDLGAIMANGPLEFKPDVNVSGEDEIVFYNNVDEETMRIHTDGNVGIGVADPTQKLEVDGTIKATSFVTSTASFPDYVFSNNYKKLSLNNLDQYIQANKHLPNMPAEAEVVANGLDVADVVIKSVENIETIYLHLIEMNQKLNQLQQENAALRAQLNK